MASYRSRLVKIPQVARMTISGMKDTDIAPSLNMSYAGLVGLKQSQEYKDYFALLFSTHIGAMDATLADNTKMMKEHYKSIVPLALQGLVETVKQTKDLKARLMAAKEILDRDPAGTFNGQAKSEDTQPEIPDTVMDNAAVAGNKIATNYKVN